MFATLVVALPSRHSSGEVHATFRRKTKTLSTAPASAFDCSYLAWCAVHPPTTDFVQLTVSRYSDVQHAVERVTEGHRLVFTYNLIHKSHVIQDCASAIDDASLSLRQTLNAWTRAAEDGCDYPAKLIHMFEHQYTQANLRLAPSERARLCHR